MRVFLFDTETTDLIRNRYKPIEHQPHIIELFGLILEAKTSKVTKKTNWKEKGTFNSLFDPGIPLTPTINRITGLFDADLKGAPKFSEKADEIVSLIESSDMIVAHNLSFDRDMLGFELVRAGKKVKLPKQVCTVEATEHLLGRRLKLIELHQELFGEPFEGAHRAENDVRPMARCFIELYSRGLI